jgi:hypothetical protein
MHREAIPICVFALKVDSKGVNSSNALGHTYCSVSVECTRKVEHRSLDSDTNLFR